METTNKFRFDKQLTNKISIDEMFMVIHSIKTTFNFTIKELSNDVSKKIVVVFENDVKITIKTIWNVEHLHLIVETSLKEHFDKLWDFFQTLT